VTGARALAVDLDALCDTRVMWRDWLEAAAPLLGVDPRELPEDRAEAGAVLDAQGAGNWRTLLGRWSEERAPVYFRRDARVGAALRGAAASGWEIGVFTDAPDPLAHVALAHLGADRRIVALETGEVARARIVRRLGPNAVVVETREQLLDLRLQLVPRIEAGGRTEGSG
jgi:phosphoglycolate phosphatase-like HAD superfamily hydrolase